MTYKQNSICAHDRLLMHSTLMMVKKACLWKLDLKVTKSQWTFPRRESPLKGGGSGQNTSQQ